MMPGYKAEETALKKIINRNCKPVETTSRVKLNIFYRSPTVTSLIMQNNVNKDKTPLKQTNVVYRYKCQAGDCALLPNSGYIGCTTTTLSRRLSMHLQNGGPQVHSQNVHNTKLTRQDIVSNTTILARATDRRRLIALEAICIREEDPTINRQLNARGTLQLYEGPRMC